MQLNFHHTHGRRNKLRTCRELDDADSVASTELRDEFLPAVVVFQHGPQSATQDDVRAVRRLPLSTM